MSPHLPGPALRELLMIITDHKMLCHSFAAPKNVMTHLSYTWDLAKELNRIDRVVLEILNSHKTHLLNNDDDANPGLKMVIVEFD